MKGIGRAEESDLRRAERSRQMHRRGIDRHEQSRPRDERGEGEQIELAREIDDRMPQMLS